MNTLDIEKICSLLNEKAVAIGFFNEPVGVIKAGADALVREYCHEQNLTSHLVSPYRWSFNKDGYEIRSGLIEFEPKSDSKSMRFTWADVSSAKITEAPRSRPAVVANA